MRIGRRLALGTALAWATACTSPPPPAPPPPAPAEPELARNQARVEGLRTLGPYLEARLAGRGGSPAFLFVDGDACRRALREGAVVTLVPAHPLVKVVAADGATCPASGLSGLAGWRDQLPARRASFLIVTAPAELSLVQEGDGVLVAQGKLPLALELRWHDPLALAAVLPDTPACRAHLALPRTEMEFRPRGDDALVLRGRLDPCPVLAIADPLLLD
jgi:hypothetical protein